MPVTVTEMSTTLLRPDHGYTFVEVPTLLLKLALAEITTEAIAIEAGLQDKTALGNLVGYWLRECGLTKEDIERIANT